MSLDLGSFTDPTYVYASALSLPIGLLSISLFLMPQKKVHITSASQKEPAKPDQELLALQQAVQANPQSFEAWTDLAYRQHKLDLNNDALASANKALALNKRYGRAWMVRGAALSTMDGQEDIALEALDRARIAGRVGRKAGSIALGGGKGLAKGSFQAGKLFWKEICRN